MPLRSEERCFVKFMPGNKAVENLLRTFCIPEKRPIFTIDVPFFLKSSAQYSLFLLYYSSSFSIATRHNNPLLLATKQVRF
jgi:hypothetical protein